MKPFVVKPVVVELDYPKSDMGKPHWNFYWLSLFPLALGAVLVTSSVYQVMTGMKPSEDGGELLVTHSLMGVIATYLGLNFWGLGRYIRDAKARQDATDRLLAEQADRIRRLEAELAAHRPS